MRRKAAYQPRISFWNHFIILAMASLLALTMLSLSFFLLLRSPSAAARRSLAPTGRNRSPISEIHRACLATRFPDLCESSISKIQLPDHPKSTDIILAAMQVAAENVVTAQSMVESILRSSGDNKNLTFAARNCRDHLEYSRYRISLSSPLEMLTGGRIKDARAWMSAALLYQYDCFSALKYVNISREINQTMSFLISLTDLTSNSLSMLFSYDNFGDDISLWRLPATERDDFWEKGSSSAAVSGFRGGIPSSLKVDATVCKKGDGDGCYSSVQSAVDAAPENLDGGRKFVIYIKAGLYKEIVRVPPMKKNLIFIGDGMGKTIITGDLYSGLDGISTYNTATVGVNADGFMARDLTFQNTAGPDAHQAVAFRLDSDLSVLERCEFLGNQDTLYAHSLRQFYNSCRVVGNVDFIFGNSAAVFQDSTLLFRPRQLNPEKGEKNALAAQGRTDAAQLTGFVFQNCLINGTDEYMALYHSNSKVHNCFLGRPWKEYSRTVFIRCYLEELIRPQGWLPWDGRFALSTLYYGEFGSSGPGAMASNRVNWSSQIPEEHVSVYSVNNFIQGKDWLPSVPS